MAARVSPGSVSGHGPGTGGASNPALPVANGTLGIWLFLTTEFMLFAALVGAWLVLRFSAGENWPTAATMHAQWPVGLLNTAILLASGWTAWRAVDAAENRRAGNSRCWIVATIVLGGLFLTIKFFELREKQAAGLLSASWKPSVRGEADAGYVAALGERLRLTGAGQSGAMGAPESLVQGSAGDAAGALEVSGGDLVLVTQGLVGWTARTAGRTADDSERQSLFDGLAAMVYPRYQDRATGPAWSEELEVLKARADELAAQQSTKAELLKRLQADLAAVTEATGGSAARSQSLRSEAAAETAELTGLNAELVAIRQRIAALERFLPTLKEGNGINKTTRLGLPVAVPGGPAWMSSWLMLTGMHAVHLVGGLLVWGWLLLVPAGDWWRAAVANSARYWHFVDVVWLVVFAIVYF
jgi:cytochrome c oxidase subunit 3